MKYGNQNYDINFLYNEEHACNSKQEALWCIEKQRIIPSSVSKESQLGTIRSPSCFQVTYDKSYICFECRKLPCVPSLRLRVLRKAKCKIRKVNRVNNSRLSNRERLSKLDAYRKAMCKQRVKVARATQKFLRLKGKLATYSDLMAEQGLRGDTAAMSNSLRMAHTKGQAEGRGKTAIFVKNIITNMQKKPKGKRYSKFTKSMYEVARIWGGWRMVKFFSENLDGPGEGTIKRICRATTKKGIEGGFQTSHLKDTKEMYKNLMSQHKVDAVLVEQAEDETSIIKLLQFMQKQDRIVGSCGKKGVGHKCNPSYHLVVGDTSDAYKKIEDFFEESVVSHMARVIMLNPLHVNLPPFVIYLAPTCNIFNHDDVKDQWRQVQTIYNEHLLEIFKAPLVAKASDGDSRRRKAMEMSAKSNDGERFTIGSQNFTLSGRIERDAHGVICSLNIMNQDYIHNGKKLTYPLDHATRRLCLGGHTAHISHLELAHERFSSHEHGLRIEDIKRTDRQNWGSAQRLFFSRVRECLKKIENGESGRKEDVKGTTVYLDLCHMYVEIFCSFKLGLLERVHNASTVTNFLRIWCRWIFKQKELNLKNNFLTLQCYKDICLSCHAAVLLIKAGREFTPTQAVPLAKSGSDCCEDFFSQNGSWVMNKHNYTFGDMLTMLPQMNRINELRADPDGPSIPKGHKKQVNIWEKGNEIQVNGPDLTDYPDDKSIVSAWEKGLETAQNMCKDLGMSPRQQTEEDENLWFTQPHVFSDKEDRIITEEMIDEEVTDKTEPSMNAQDLDMANAIRHEMDEDLHDQSDEIADHKYSPTIQVPGKSFSIHKSTLVSMLNSNDGEKLSKDRLRRVQASKSFGKTQVDQPSDIVNANHRKVIGLYSDIAVLETSNKKYLHVFGRVQRLIKVNKRGKTEYKRPVDLDEHSKENIQVHVVVYEQEEMQWCYCPGRTKVVHISNVIMGVELNVKENDKYEANENDLKDLQKYINSKNEKRIKRKHNNLETRQQTVETNNEIEQGSDGRVVVVAEPDVNLSGSRRSSRSRRCVVFDT
eukprot:Seg2203.8 transcript_id=Seg2203.8/GoldUCD/mRNA.D3Y31 product="hypothetical protein" protein_id=Seg2203.8/GoldUCD/D3Y31